MTRQAVSTRIPGIVLGPSMSYDWFTVNKATMDQSQLMLVTKAIPVTLVPKPGAGEGCGVLTTNFWKKVCLKFNENETEDETSEVVKFL